MHPADCIVAFDFDGTLTHTETLSRFLLRGLPWTRLALAMLRIPMGIVHLCKRGWSRSHVKEEAIGLFTRGLDAEVFLAYAHRYARAQLSSYISPERLAILKSYQKRGVPIYLVSGSLAAYLKPWGEEQGIQGICGVDLEIDTRGCLSGRFAGLNCWAQEKVHRLSELVDLSEHSLIVFGDTIGDQALMERAWEAHHLPRACK